MAPSLRHICAFVFLLAAFASAEESRIPSDFVRVDQVGRIVVMAARKDFLEQKSKWELQTGLKSILERFDKMYSYEKEVIRMGRDGGIFKHRTDASLSTAVLLLFDDQEKFVDWTGAPHVAGITYHVGRFENVVGVPLNGNALGPGVWHVLWHEFGHVFFLNHLLLGEPIWLNEGLSEYFGHQNPSAKGEKSPQWQPMLDALKARRESGKATLVKDLLEVEHARFNRQHYDESWVLVHLLMTEATSQLNGLMAVLCNMEEDAYEGAAAVTRDLKMMAKKRLTDSFGGEAALQKAWDDHLAAVLENPDKPAKLALSLRTLDTTSYRPLIEARISGTSELVEIENRTYKARKPKGSVVFRGPEKGTIQVTVRVGDAKKNWFKGEWIVVEEREVKPREKIEFRELLIPHYEGAAYARVMVYWKLPGGGQYRTELVIHDK